MWGQGIELLFSEKKKSKCSWWIISPALIVGFQIVCAIITYLPCQIFLLRQSCLSVPVNLKGSLSSGGGAPWVLSPSMLVFWLIWSPASLLQVRTAVLTSWGQLPHPVSKTASHVTPPIVCLLHSFCFPFPDVPRLKLEANSRTKTYTDTHSNQLY